MSRLARAGMAIVVFVIVALVLLWVRWLSMGSSQTVHVYPGNIINSAELKYSDIIGMTVGELKQKLHYREGDTNRFYKLVVAPLDGSSGTNSDGDIIGAVCGDALNGPQSSIWLGSFSPKSVTPTVKDKTRNKDFSMADQLKRQTHCTGISSAVGYTP